MERLTHEQSNRFGYWSPHRRQDVINQLGLYEDTGLTPAEVREMAEREKRKKDK